jgi:ribonuclease E
MKQEMLINVSEGEECRIAILEDGVLEELYMERTSATSHVGNIYKGRVTNVEPSIQAAFIDFGLGRNGFLHISDLMPTYFGRGGEDVHETVGRKMARRDRPPIQRCLRRGDEIVVQIIKEGIGTKGPTLTTYLSIPGRILVMMPGLGKMGVSRKIEDEEERRRLRHILDSLKPPKDVGFIIRTAGIGKSKTDIQRDLTYLTRLWLTLEKKRTSGSGPMELYTEGDLVTRTVRDFFSNDIDAIVVDNKEVARRVKEVIKLANPRTKNKVDLYEEAVPLFHRYGIERDIELMYSRHVPLPSGGSLVIDSTEAVVAIDVNSGKFRDHSDAETTAFKTDMEAADEIPRQLRLRDLGGVIICDFIDLRYERHRRELEKRLHDNFKNDRAKTKVLRMSQFGIIEMTRQRMRPSLKRSIYFDCPHCKGAGLVKTPESMSLDVMRRLAIAVTDQRVLRVELTVCSDVAFYLQNRKRQQIVELENNTRKRVIIKSDATLGLDEMRLDPFDARDGLVIIEELSAVLTPQPHTTQLGARRPMGNQQRGRGGRPDNRGRGGPPQRPQLPPPRAKTSQQEGLDLERDEEDFEERGDREDQIDREVPVEQEDADDRDEVIGREEEMEAGVEAPNVSEESLREESPEDEPFTPALDTEAGSEAAEDTSGNRADGTSAGNDQGEDGPRRRRRRRGRRGRGGRGGGGGGQNQNPQPPIPQNKGPVGSNPNIRRDDRRPPRRNDRDEIGDAPQAMFPDEPHEIEETSPHEEDFRDESHAHESDVGVIEPSGDGATDIDSEGRPPSEPDTDGPPRKRRRRRGGRGRGRGGKVAAEDRPVPNAEPVSESEEDEISGNRREPEPRGDAQSRREPQRREPQPRREPAARREPLPRNVPEPRRLPPPPPAPPALPPPPLPMEIVPRTGSTDRHLVHDEPILPEPLKRPRSYRDLDQIPDDLEDR